MSDSVNKNISNIKKSDTTSFKKDLLRDSSHEFIHHLPLHSEVSANGGIDFAPPQGTLYYDFEKKVVYLDHQAAGSFFPPYLHCDSDLFLSLDLPQETFYDEDHHMISISNTLSSQLIPEYVDIQNNGAILMYLDSIGTVDTYLKYIIINSKAIHQFLPSYCTTSHNKGIDFILPERSIYNEKTRHLLLSFEYANEYLPDDLILLSDGSISIELPWSTHYDHTQKTILFPKEVSEFAPAQEDERFHHYLCYNKDNSVLFTLPESMVYDNGTIHVPQSEATRVLQYGLQTTPEGCLLITMPYGTYYSRPSVLHVPAEHSRFILPHGVDIDGSGNVIVQLPKDTSIVDNKTILLESVHAGFVLGRGLEVAKNGTLFVRLPETVLYKNNQLHVPHTLSRWVLGPNYNYHTGLWYQLPGFGSCENNVLHIANDTALLFRMPLALGLGARLGFGEGGIGYGGGFGINTPLKYHTNPRSLPSNTCSIPGQAMIYTSKGTIQSVPQTKTIIFNSIAAKEWLADQYRIDENGSIVISLPDCTLYDDRTRQLQLPARYSSLLMPDYLFVQHHGGLEIELPPSHLYDSLHETIEIDLHEASLLHTKGKCKLLPRTYTISNFGTIQIHCPRNTVFDENHRTVILPNSFAQEHLSRWCILQKDGSVAIKLPPQILIDTHDKIITNPIGENTFGLLAEYPIFSSRDGGTTLFNLQEGMNIHVVDNTLTIPHYLTHTIFPQHLCTTEHGELKIRLIHGLDFIKENRKLSVHHEMVKYFIPPFMRITRDGIVHIRLPHGCIYQKETATLSIPHNLSHIFLPPHVVVSDDGSVRFTVPKAVQFQNNTLVIPKEIGAWSLFPDFKTDIHGTLIYKVKHGTFNATSSQVTFDEEAIHSFHMPCNQGFGFHVSGSGFFPLFNENQQCRSVMRGVDQFSQSYLLALLPKDTIIHPDGSIDLTITDTILYDEKTQNICIQKQSFAHYIDPHYTFSESGTIKITFEKSTKVHLQNNHIHMQGSSSYLFGPYISIENDGTIHWDMHPDILYDHDHHALVVPHALTWLVLPDRMWCDSNGTVYYSVFDDATVDWQDKTVTFPSELSCAVLPQSMFSQHDGSIKLFLPPDAECDAIQNKVTLSRIHERFFDIGINYASRRPNGSYCISLQKPLHLDAENKIITIPHQLTKQFLPQLLRVMENGDITILLPQGCKYNYNHRIITIPHEYTRILLNKNISIDSFGCITITLPPEVSYHDETGEISCSFNTADFLIPYQCFMDENGTMSFPLPAHAKLENSSLYLPKISSWWALSSLYYFKDTGELRMHLPYATNRAEISAVRIPPCAWNRLRPALHSFGFYKGLGYFGIGEL